MLDFKMPPDKLLNICLLIMFGCWIPSACEESTTTSFNTTSTTTTSTTTTSTTPDVAPSLENSNNSTDDPSPRLPRILKFFHGVDKRPDELVELQEDIKKALYFLDSAHFDVLQEETLRRLKRKLQAGLVTCPLNRGAVRIGDSCYEFFVNLEDFPTARQVCRSFGGDLASINLEENFLFHIRKYYPTLAIDGTINEAWLGALRVPGTSNFQFFNGDIIYPTNARWNAGPRHFDCLILDDIDLPQDFIIDDCHCFNTRSFLCQYPLQQIF